MTNEPYAWKLDWRKAPMAERWYAKTPLGLVTVALKSAGRNRGKIWIATLSDGREIATSPNSNEAKQLAEYHAERLASESQP